MQVLISSEKEGIGQDSEERKVGRGGRARVKGADRDKEDSPGCGSKDKEAREKRQDGSRGKKHKALEDISFFKH